MKVSCYLLDVSMYILIERMDKNIYSTNISAGERIGSEKSYCNPSHIYLRIIPSNVRNVDDMRGNARCYFPGGACRGHVRIKSFRAVTFPYAKVVYQHAGYRRPPFRALSLAIFEIDKSESLKCQRFNPNRSLSIGSFPRGPIFLQ